MDLRLGGCTYPWLWKADLNASIDYLKRIGIRTLELMLMPPHFPDAWLWKENRTEIHELNEYIKQNDLTIVELTVDDVRDYLEQIAGSYLGAARDGEPPPLHPGISIYNHDTLAGVEYVIDPARPEGDRITRLTFEGERRSGESVVTLALTSYRAQGGGGYRALKRARIVERTGREMRVLLSDYIREKKEIRPEVFGNWRVEGGNGAR